MDEKPRVIKHVEISQVLPGVGRNLFLEDGEFRLGPHPPHLHHKASMLYKAL
jgi:hypothetical protein